MIELIFAIVVVAITVMSLPLMTDVTLSGSADRTKAEEAIFEAYVKALEITDGTYGTAPSDTNITQISLSDRSAGLKYYAKMDVSISLGSGFGGLDQNDTNISKVSVTVLLSPEKSSGFKQVAKIHAYDFNISR